MFFNDQRYFLQLQARDFLIKINTGDKLQGRILDNGRRNQIAEITEILPYE